eukprot:CAMPEP_0198146376 /NCGR_PEP_ID=MMETSP1443-20131203/29100_1 /TAXON_ID=186043 /ORGANISM="Entomoneis sp., Strain CCMP2396" /LENGTH=199 /DNA_ID=CAMNT_0043810321 /DNA_START=157 /DNA_END=753 /DNA_ORIENTATION=-
MSSLKLLPASLQNSLQEVVKLCNRGGAELRAITLSTTEGVPLGRVYGEHETHLNEETLTLLETVWAPASKQLPVLGLDNSKNSNNNNNKAQNQTTTKNNSNASKMIMITAMYDHGILVHLYLAPIVVTCLCKTTANLGAIKSTAVPLLQQVLEPLRNTLLESLKPEEDEDHQQQHHQPEQDGSMMPAATTTTVGGGNDA